MHILGDTLPEIAAEKVGIMKPGCPFITAEQRPELLAIFQHEAQQHETHVQVLGEEFRIEHVHPGKESTRFDYISEQQTYRELRTPICGAYQARNAALALRAVEIVSKKNSVPVQEDALRKALLSIRIPGRFERVADDPVVILDAAHNPDKMVHLVSYLQQRFVRDEIIFVCAFTSGKKPEVIFMPMLEVSRTFYLTRAVIGFREDEEPLYLKSILNSLCSSVNAIIALDPFSALEMAMTEARKHGKVVCVTGSAYVVAYLRQRWYPEHQMLQFIR
jgi:dihydrofolate synthase/folylpolyglutamate synthase